MTTAQLVLVLLLLLTLLTVAPALAREVRRDGYGRRPTPASHHTWDEDLLG